MQTHPRFLTAMLAVLLAAPGLHAQQCNDRNNRSAPDARYTIHDDGTVTDNRTGLTWQRCAMGFAFSDNGTPATPGDDTCTSSATTAFSWQEALQGAADLNAQGGFAGFTDWRVPNVKELVSLVETACADPAINTVVFPDTPASEAFFSASPSNSATPTTSVKTVEFGTGIDGSELVQPSGGPVLRHVRLVR